VLRFLCRLVVSTRGGHHAGDGESQRVSESALNRTDYYDPLQFGPVYVERPADTYPAGRFAVMHPAHTCHVNFRQDFWRDLCDVSFDSSLGVEQ
jgi:hypothetical protein